MTVPTDPATPGSAESAMDGRLPGSRLRSRLVQAGPPLRWRSRTAARRTDLGARASSFPAPQNPANASLIRARRIKSTLYEIAIFASAAAAAIASAQLALIRTTTVT